MLVSGVAIERVFQRAGFERNGIRTTDIHTLGTDMRLRVRSDDVADAFSVGRDIGGKKYQALYLVCSRFTDGRHHAAAHGMTKQMDGRISLIDGLNNFPGIIFHRLVANPAVVAAVAWQVGGLRLKSGVLQALDQGLPAPCRVIRTVDENIHPCTIGHSGQGGKEMRADWYFDVISPFAYLQFQRLTEVSDRVELTLKPVLFAGLLNAHGQKGPAEIPAKRLFTYQMVTWLAKKRGVPFTMPDAHPFNPIRALRLCIALNNDPEAIGAIYHAIWGEGVLPDNDAGWQAIQNAVGISDGDALISAPDVKQQLIKNGEDAVAAGVFGVPSFVAEGKIFWGDDALGFFSDWLNDPGVLENPAMQKLNTLPSSAERPR